MRIRVDGIDREVKDGTSVAAAVLNFAVQRFRTSVSGEARAPVCGMGVCHECRATVDGEPHVRTCMILCREGMEVETGG
ncbi:MAG TPA: (2Fe-2S)-binding protein [Fimbriimonadaceae bacterium]|nr:(2Fe-2S)-binding protein [Fimbriimonadaceae bacterium]